MVSGVSRKFLGAKIETLGGFMKPDKKINLNSGVGFRGGGLGRSARTIKKSMKSMSQNKKICVVYHEILLGDILAKNTAIIIL